MLVCSLGCSSTPFTRWKILDSTSPSLWVFSKCPTSIDKACHQAEIRHENKRCATPKIARIWPFYMIFFCFETKKKEITLLTNHQPLNHWIWSLHRKSWLLWFHPVPRLPMAPGWSIQRSWCMVHDINRKLNGLEKSKLYKHITSWRCKLKY